MTIVRLAWQSLWNRRITVLLTVLAIALSVMLLLGVEKVRIAARESFAGTLSGADVIIGARTGPTELLLYSIFHIGNATNNVTWRSYQDIVSRPEVAWSIPLSLGDSHRGFRVIGTTSDFFAHYRYRDDQQVSFTSGGALNDLFDVVIGSDVAGRLGYRVGDKIIVAHGLGALGPKHDDMPFQVSGILAPTGTPVDKSLLVSLQAIEAIHFDWRGGYRLPGVHTSPDQLRHMNLRPKAITAAIIGLKSRLAVIGFQRTVDDYAAEPLSAILPGVALQEMWDLVGTAENALFFVSAMVAVTAFLGLATMIFSTLNERRRELAILRSVGAGPGTIVRLLVSEAAILTLAGILLGLACLYTALFFARPLIDSRFGIHLDIDPPSVRDMELLGAILLGGLVAGILPALRAYRLSVADGMMVRS